MKKLLIGLSAILVLAVLFVGALFAYTSYKDLQLEKQKLQTEQKEVKKEKENKKEKEQQQNTESQQQATNENDQQTTNNNVAENDNVNTSNEVQQNETSTEEPVYSANGREEELAAEGEVKSPGEPGSTSREITPETDPELFELEEE
ncbi:hypothetical protein CPT_Machias_022 [Staphylococcus phage Machias]|nr:hypothetical protein CPT_Machias_022 [Staphylococcus phage Machias]